ncbi:class I SAM-dependent methyltransferase [Candidatus Woesearchaeota archaeon]|nr:class I SAM-dependent methyltransferase [Candidatus Woesearchaeota archaeon]
MEDYYSQISKSYNELHKEEQLKKLAVIKKNIEIKNSDLLLDVGCGTGISSQFNCKVIGIDPSIGLLRLNKKRNKILAKAENLPFKNNAFDIVVSVTALHNFDNIEKALKEIKRVGKNKFVFSVLKKSKRISRIKTQIKKNFKIKKMIEKEEDILFFLRNKNYINNYD